MPSWAEGREEEEEEAASILSLPAPAVATHTMAAIFRQLCLLVLTEACYDEFFVKFNFFDGNYPSCAVAWVVGHLYTGEPGQGVTAQEEVL